MTTSWYALRFPSNISGSDQSAPFVAIKYANPHLNGFPFWGPSNQGVTLIRRIKYAQQTGYYADWWYTDDSSFEDSKSGSRGYYGFHPYPSTSTNAGTTHYHEIATDDGGDFYTSKAGSPITVVKGQWYTQALKVVRTNANSKTFTLYTNLPSVADADVVEHTVTFSNYGEASPPQVNPQITLGDSPWYGTYQHERSSSQHASWLMIMKAMSQADIVTQSADFTQLLVQDAIDWIWWGKKGFQTVDDLTCDFGTGRSFVWADSSNKATLGEIVLQTPEPVSYIARTGLLSLV